MLNRTGPDETPNFEGEDTPEVDIDTSEISLEEIKTAINKLKSGMSPGIETR